MSTVRVSVELNDEQQKGLTLVKDHMSKRMGAQQTIAAVYRFLVIDYLKRNRLEGDKDAENHTGA